MEKRNQILKVNAIARVENGIKAEPLKAENFSTTKEFADYKLLVENLQAFLYNKASGKAYKKSISVYTKPICKALELTEKETEVVVAYFSKFSSLHAGRDCNQLTAESRKELAVFNDRIKAVKANKFYTADEIASKVEAIEEEKKVWRRNNARYTGTLYAQKSPSAFRIAVENRIGYALINSVAEEAFTTSKERANTNAWLRWCGKAAELGIDAAEYKTNLDLDGLKAAVKAKYSEVHKAALELSKAAATEEKEQA